LLLTKNKKKFPGASGGRSAAPCGNSFALASKAFSVRAAAGLLYVALAKLLNRLGSGDMLVVTRLDRLARATRDLLNILDAIGKAGAKFRSIHDAWADTSTPHGELMVTILGGLATFERHLIKSRTDYGRKRAKARGARFGRPHKLDQHQRQEALQRLAKGETLVDVARTFGVDPTTIGRLELAARSAALSPTRPREAESAQMRLERPALFQPARHAGRQTRLSVSRA
jgi:DNA invertase Pin-like site-specific DNA recombinase